MYTNTYTHPHHIETETAIHKHPMLNNLGLGSDEEEVESIHVRWYASALGVSTKHTHTSALGELSIFIVEILCTWE